VIDDDPKKYIFRLLANNQNLSLPIDHEEKIQNNDYLLLLEKSEMPKNEGIQISSTSNARGRGDGWRTIVEPIEEDNKASQENICQSNAKAQLLHLNLIHEDATYYSSDEEQENADALLWGFVLRHAMQA
jgi:hypothetical protein